MTPDQQDILCMLAYVNISQGNPKDALALLQLVNRYAPDNIEMLRSLTYALILENKGDEAQSYADRLHKLDRSPNSEASVLLLRSRALLVQKRLPEARAMFRAFVRLKMDQSS